MRRKLSQINKDDIYFTTKHNRITGSLGLELVWREKPEVLTEEIYEALRTEGEWGGGRGVPPVDTRTVLRTVKVQ
jgi:hypothetical protein